MLVGYIRLNQQCEVDLGQLSNIKTFRKQEFRETLLIK